MKHTLPILFTMLLCGTSAFPQEGCYSRLQNDTLTIGNSRIERRFVWNGGNLMTQSLTDFSSGQVWTSRSLTPDFKVAGDTRSTGGRCSTKRIAETDIHPARLEITVEFSLGTLDVRRVYRICADTPAIACDTYLKGSAAQLPESRAVNAADRKNIESTADMQSQPVAATLDRFNPGGFHWHTRIVEFQDVTDWNNNLVFETDVIPYRKNSYRGNLLFARNAENGRGFFFLKEAPGSGVQLAYGGGDFTAEFGDFTVTGLGVTEKDLREGEWVKAYGCVLGVWSGGELEQLTALRSYQKNLRKLLPGRDEMVMMNTWGDRSQDTKVNERFCLAEVRKAAHLGITHFQIDDGWQVGKSPNSAVAKGSFKNIWDNPDYWKPDPEKYPRGLHPVVELGRELGVEICLWFNPSVQDGYADWEKDAQALVGLYDEYGIRTFKIDGLAIPDKRSESNLRRLFDRVLERTGGRVVFNLDATAGRRGGYHMFNEYGNIFLENRYTDWQNYYPYWTLRNLWMLSKYVPAEKLQIEFLNKWRNTEKYAGDPFAPGQLQFRIPLRNDHGRTTAGLDGGERTARRGAGHRRADRTLQRGAARFPPRSDPPRGRRTVGPLVDRIPVGRRRAGLPDLLPRAEPRPEGPDRNVAPRELESAPHAGAGEREGRRAEDRTPRNAGGGTSRAQRLRDVPLRTDPLTNHKS